VLANRCGKAGADPFGELRSALRRPHSNGRFGDRRELKGHLGVLRASRPLRWPDGVDGRRPGPSGSGKRQQRRKAPSGVDAGARPGPLREAGSADRSELFGAPCGRAGDRSPSGETGQHGEEVPSGATEPTDTWKAAGLSGPAADQAHRTDQRSCRKRKPKGASGGRRWQHPWPATDSPVEQSPEVDSLVTTHRYRVRAGSVATTSDNGERAVTAVTPDLCFGLRTEVAVRIDAVTLPGRGKLRRVCAIGKGPLPSASSGAGGCQQQQCSRRERLATMLSLLSDSAERRLETWRTPWPAAGCNKPAGCFAE